MAISNVDRRCPGPDLGARGSVRPQRVLVVIFLFSLAACSGLQIDETPTHRSLLGDQRPSSCLAMSGGGIRSGAVSLGALQGLHATNELSKFEFISTVSGGGYPIYGLLYRMIRNGAPLADLLAESGEHIAKVDDGSDFIDESDIYSAAILGPTLWAALSWPFRVYGAARPTYEATIHGTFAGGLAPLWGVPNLASAKDIRRQGFPVPIFGTSASIGSGQPRNGYVYDARHFFELSPTLSGAPITGYFATLSNEIDIAAAVAMSAAAIDTPQGKLQLPEILKVMNLGLGGNFRVPVEMAPDTHFYLADGGFIENLGLLPLLRRGCKEILAFDNSDDAEAPFEAWLKFKNEIASQEGWTIARDLRAQSGSPLPTQDPERWTLHDHIWDAVLVRNNDVVRLRLVKLGIDKDKLQDYPESVRQFAPENWEGYPALHCDTGTGLHRRCPFPLEATARQSFKTREFRAYRHLGKWLAEIAVRLPPSDYE